MRLHRQTAPQRNGPRPPLADLGVLVEVGERSAVQDLVSEHAGLDRVDEVHPYGVLLEPAHQRLEALDVHRLVETLAQRLANERMVWDIDRTRRGVVLTGRKRREYGGHHVVRLHPLDVERIDATALAA